MTKRTIAIGDIHGCALALDTLLKAVAPRHDDTIVTLGDCIDRGPDSRGVIERLVSLQTSCQLVSLLGNHEEMMLNWLEGRPQPEDWLACGGAETLASYAANPDPRSLPREHVDLARQWIDYFETETHFFVHGNYDPNQPLSRQRWHLHRWIPLRQTIPGPHINGRTAILGHTSQQSGEILDLGHLQCIDTFCHGGGWLTALDVTTGTIWQANRDGALR